MRRGLKLATASTLVLSLALTLAACQQAEDRAAADMAAATAADVAELSITEPAADAAAARAAAPTALPMAPVAPPAPIAQIAYIYRYGLSVPRDRGAEMMSRHELACASAGAGYCQVVSAQADWTGRRPSGVLELRGQPEWINRFRAGLALDAQNAGGKLEEAVTEGEDVTGGIGRATTGVATSQTLTARIEALQAQRGGTMAQKLEVERQLAELMRQRDEYSASLRELETRVQTAKLTINYRQGGIFAADNPTRPVAEAVSNAFGLSMGMLAVLITLGSVALPVVAIGGAVWWAVIRRRKRPISA